MNEKMKTSQNIEWMTRYSPGISIALHLLFLVFAGNMFMVRHNPPKPQKFKLHFVAPKPPPETKKVEETLKVEPQPLPKPTVKKLVEASVRQEIAPITAAKRVSAQEIMPMATPMPEALVPRTEGMGRASLVQNSAHRVMTADFAPRSIQTAGTIGTEAGNHVKIVSSGVKKISEPSGGMAPRPAPEIVDTPKAVDNQILKNYLGMIQKKIERSKEYPDIARRAGSEGRVKVQFTILKDGRIENPVLIEKAPFRVLNEEVLAALNRAAPFERFPDEIGKESVNVILPFSFLLN
ncbi:MAG: hypothetical protein A3K09_00130 [Nitrospinae bacterium RIFCSPLOWO2_12_FULL_47_7]|nr:MAG: hypothetical protein A3K09_00130 [Nitrospinae bacterium RIFCSPLOWO2_12_FULL_47_7]